jgi:hypothetical protein
MYLMIRNPGVADYRGFTLIGASTTRNANLEGTSGQFGSGSKNSCALLLRNKIRPIVYTGNLRLEFFSKAEHMQGQTFNRVAVKYSGKDSNGTTKNNTEDLGFALEWGVKDWTNITMAYREFVSNAIDGSISSGHTHTDIEFKVVDEPRAKAGHTSVFLPYTTEIEEAHRELSTMFLHFGNPSSYLKSKLLPKKHPELDKVLVYKKGVLVSTVDGKSVFDYNLGNELDLDESRNASSWDVRYAIAHALQDASSEQLAEIMKKLLETSEVWEGQLDSTYLTSPTDIRNVTWQKAWKSFVGENGVAVSGIAQIAAFVENKGFTPYTVLSPSWLSTMAKYGIATETKVLSSNEVAGNVPSEATEDMKNAVNWAWSLIESFGLTNGKTKPEVSAFTSIMTAGTQLRGYYENGKIYLHTDLGDSKLLKKVALEELVHHITGAEDNSRDMQDYLLRLVVAVCD